MHLDTRLAQRMAADYPQLNTKYLCGSRAAQRLVDRRLMRPVLDGLDEVPQLARPKAIAALTAVVGRERPLVLTCRAEEYQAAIASRAQCCGAARHPVSSRSPIGDWTKSRWPTARS